MSKKQNIFERFVARLDRLQQRHAFLSFPLAVIKKYGEDEAGHQAALVTYYGFLSIFPLLIVATSVVDIVSLHNVKLRTDLLSDFNHYFPIGGQQLQSSILGHSKSGVALAVGTIVALYGARGIADAIRNMLDHAWAIPRARRSGFPKNILKSLLLLIGGMFGLAITATLTSFATSAVGHSLVFRIVPILINVGLLYLIFMYVLVVGTSRRLPRSNLRIGALTAAIGLLILQAIGIVLVKHQLHNLNGLYGQFGLVLAIISWVYLQAQIFTYAVEISVVHARKLWPRSLTKPLTAADKKAYRMYAEMSAMLPQVEEAIDVTFHDRT